MFFCEYYDSGSGFLQVFGLIERDFMANIPYMVGQRRNGKILPFQSQ